MASTAASSMLVGSRLPETVQQASPPWKVQLPESSAELPGAGGRGGGGAGREAMGAAWPVTPVGESGLGGLSSHTD